MYILQKKTLNHKPKHYLVLLWSMHLCQYLVCSSNGDGWKMPVLICFAYVNYHYQPDIIAFDEWWGLFSLMHHELDIDVWRSPIGTVPADAAALRLPDNLDLRLRSVGVWLSCSAHIISSQAQHPDLGKVEERHN